MLNMENYQGTTDYNLLEDKDIVNNLTTTATNKVLSASQGKTLNDTINSIINVSEYHVTMKNNADIYLKKFGKIVIGVIKCTTSYTNHNDNLGTLDEEYRPARRVYIPYTGWIGVGFSGYGQYDIETNGVVSYKTTEIANNERNAIFAYYTL